MAVILSLAFCLPLAAQDNPLVQRGVPAQGLAADAVTARERAHAAATRTAFQQMMRALGISRATPSDGQLAQMVAAIIIEQERTGPNRYDGRLTIQFSAGAISALIGRPVGAAVGEPGGEPGGGPVARPSGETGEEPPAAGLNIPMAATGSVLATARHGSLDGWVELRRRLLESPAVVSVDVLAMTMETARVRLGLSQPPDAAAAALAASGIMVEPDGADWQVGLGFGQ